MRTSEKFNKIWQDLVWYVNFHQSSVWLVALDNDYALSVIKPTPDELPFGTVANLYNKDLQIEDFVESNRTPY